MHPNTEIRSWSTRSVPAPQRFDYYSAALESSLLPMSVSAPDPSTFEAEISAADVGPMSVALISTSAHRALRSTRELARSANDSFHLVVALGAPCNLEHRDARVALRQGDATFVDARYGHDFFLDQGTTNINLTFHSDWVRQWLPSPQDLVGRILPRDSGWVRALTSFTSGLTPDFLVRSPLPTSVLSDQVGALLALAASELKPAEHTATPAERSLLELVRDCIRQRASEASLSADEVARTVGTSPRTLHRTLASAGDTFGALLMSTRVDLAIRMLESPLLARLTIEQIGMRAGFVDPSHFARAVRSRAGFTPSQVRRRRLKD